MSKEPGKFLTAHWRHLAMLNYEVDPLVLQPYLPQGTELDTWNGKTFVSMVGFQFLKTSVLGIPIPFHRNFEEVNLRFYVRRRASDEIRRGVVFIKEIVPQKATAWVARHLYNENYVALPMRHEDTLAASTNRGISYEWRLGGSWNQLSVAVEGEAAIPAADSEAAFITEHYWGYSAQKDGSTLEYKVEHPQWPVWRATGSKLNCDVEHLYGPEFTPFLAAEPTSAFLALGSDVSVRRGVSVN